MRDFNYDINGLIKTRWSPRAFSREPVEYEEVMAILEAARYAPSCFNEQPWEFLLAFEDRELELVRQAINDRNRLWVDNAPVLIVATARPTFEKNEKPNRWAAFDTGTAWGYMSLEAEKRGLIMHAMAGFSRKKLRELTGLPEDMEIIAIVAVGKMGDKSELNETFLDEEKPKSRKPLNEVYTRINKFMEE